VIPFSLRSQPPGPFLAARAFRLWPAYAVALLLTLLGLALARGLLGGTLAPLPPFKSVLAHLLFARDLADLPMLDGIVWTLEVEARFYLFCALIVSSLRSGRALPLLALAAAGAALALLTRDCLWLHKGRHLLHAAQVALQMITFMLIGVLFH